MLKKVLMIANPGSGRGLAPEYADRLGTLLEEVYHSQVVIRKTTQVGDAKEWARSAKAEQFDTVICLGGDGTVSEVINGLMLAEDPPVFSFVPIGTANDLGRVLGFDMNPDRAVEQFKRLEIDAIDIGQVNEQYFMDIVALGDIPKAVMETDYEQKNKYGFFAYVVDGVKAAVDGAGRNYQVTNSNGTVFELNSDAILVALTSSIAGMENMVEHRDYKDGLMQFVGLKGNIITSAVDTLVSEGGIPDSVTDDENLLAFSDSHVTIHLKEEAESQKMYANVDGDEGPALPLEIKVHRAALKVLRPEMEK